MPDFEGRMGAKTILGNREHKTNFQFWRNRGKKQLISGEQENGYPLGGPYLCTLLTFFIYGYRLIGILPNSEDPDEMP